MLLTLGRTASPFEKVPAMLSRPATEAATTKMRHDVLYDRGEPCLEVLRVHDPGIRLGRVPYDRTQLPPRDRLHDGSVRYASCSRCLAHRQVAADGSRLIGEPSRISVHALPSVPLYLSFTRRPGETDSLLIGH